MTKFIHGYVSNDILEINDKDESNMYVRTILEYLKTITEMSLNRDPEISKFFIDEAS
jgi:hypothetical protein